MAAFFDALHTVLTPTAPLSLSDDSAGGRLRGRISPKRPVHLASVCRSLWARCNGTEQTILLPVRAGGEKNPVGAKISTTRGVASDTKAPSPSMTIACPWESRILSTNSPVVRSQVLI